MTKGQPLLSAILLVVGLLIAWQLSQILLLLFAAIILATVIWSVAWPLERHTPLGQQVSLVIAVFIVILMLGGSFWLVFVLLLPDLTSLITTLPERVAAAGDVLGIDRLDEQLMTFANDMGEQTGALSHIAGYTTGFLGVVASALLVVAAGVYLALDYPRYYRGVLLLVPTAHQARAKDLLGRLGRALRLWLLGQLVAMVVVGVTTGLGLYLLGVPSALALGVLAGLLEFIPFVGPIIGFAAAVVIALSQNLTVAVLVALLYLGIQQLESNVLVPLVQQRTVDLPAALGLFGLLAFGVLFGPLGVLFGVPLTVVMLVAVKHLYVPAIAEGSDQDRKD